MLTRREFTRLAVAGAASQVVSPLLAQGGDGKIGYCIIGLGRISMDHFMPGALASKNSKITGLVSGHRDKALAPGCEDRHQKTLRQVGIGGQILSELGIRRIKLLSNTPTHVPALQGFGVEIVEQISIPDLATPSVKA